ncbi:Orphan Rhodopsin G protein-coupled receptor [Fasciolopsis buskii]|uniref:Orphan Rhodopsin G protein-coupled receptor n=1 Tax=Fasciolopsis buskii TaxID=27845 RepID=A0A8E0RZ67_9TREM|nr:Orphan Rhodopsin G protein-coupled receptor [Fasciolopsis buski]
MSSLWNSTRDDNLSLVNYTNLDYQINLPSEVTVVKNITIPILIIIFLVGMVGNTLTVLVLRTKRLRQSSTAIYLTALAIVDILYLLSSLLIHIINQTFLFPNEVRNYSSLACGLCPFLQYTLAYLSVWLIVAVTVDRAIWVTKPFKAKHICTKRHAAYTVILMTLTSVCLDSHFFWTMHFVTNPNSSNSYGECRGGPFTESITPYIDMVLLLIIPFAFMLTSNILIEWQLKKMREFGRRRRQVELPANPQSIAHQEVSSHPQSMASVAITYEYSTYRDGKPPKRLNGHESKDSIRIRSTSEKSSALTTMLMAISIFFMISVSPLMVYDVIYFAADLGKWIDKDEHYRSAVIFGIERFVYTLWYTNFAVHFILYCLNGPPFRTKAMQLFRSHCFSGFRQPQIHMNGKPNPRFTVSAAPVPQYSGTPYPVEAPACRLTRMITLHTPNIESKGSFLAPPDILLERSCSDCPEAEDIILDDIDKTGQSRILAV